MSYALLIPAAGRGERLGAPVSKALAVLEGKPLIWWALEAFIGDDRLKEIVIATSADCDAAIKSELSGHKLSSLIMMTEGGETRQDSVGNALGYVRNDVDHILVHDAARPLLSRDVIDSVLDGLKGAHAAVPGIPVTDTIKRVNVTGLVQETLKREELFAVQTPQGIRADVFRKAHALARQNAVQCTDDVALVEYFSLGTVILVPGDPQNLKVTHPHELPRAAALLHAQRHS